MNKDISRGKRPEGEFTRPPADLSRTNTQRMRVKKSWFARLFG
jgi:hypothetical protein